MSLSNVKNASPITTKQNSFWLPPRLILNCGSQATRLICLICLYKCHWADGVWQLVQHQCMYLRYWVLIRLSVARSISCRNFQFLLAKRKKTLLPWPPPPKTLKIWFRVWSSQSLIGKEWYSVVAVHNIHSNVLNILCKVDGTAYAN